MLSHLKGPKNYSSLEQCKYRLDVTDEILHVLNQPKVTVSKQIVYIASVTTKTTKLSTSKEQWHILSNHLQPSSLVPRRFLSTYRSGARFRDAPLRERSARAREVKNALRLGRQASTFTCFSSTVERGKKIAKEMDASFELKSELRVRRPLFTGVCLHIE